jgi:glycosyltransferase involved in cell wall biosynthesis
VPVIGYNSGGTEDIVKNGINGYLYANIDEIASKIIDISRNKYLLSVLSINARKYVMDEFTLQYITSKYVNLYNENKN